ncbi:chitinase [Hyaloraphidium curvatum]|nr:chitinase [Hyaloraphidium curvatum]
MVTRAEGGDGAGGDAWADYQRPFAAGESVDGVGDAPGARLRGNFNQLRKLKARLPGLRVFISIGGWTWSRWFSAAARTEALRKNLASSCVDLYLRGNLPELEGAGGAEAGRGVFDGIDIDWEYPGIQGIGYNTLSPDDGNNFSLLLAEVRRQLDLLSEETGLAYGLTAAVGAGRHTVDATDPAEYSKHLDWVNAMTYDFRGAWDAAGPTGFHARLLSDPAAPDHPHGTTAAGAIDYLLAKGVPASKLLLGVPFYGRGWTGVDPRGGGVYRPALGPAPGTFEAGAEDYRVLCGAPGTERFRAEAGQAYRFDDATGTWWAYDNPEAVAGKAAFARERGLRGLFAWAADGDRGGELLAAMAAVRG